MMLRRLPVCWPEGSPSGVMGIWGKTAGGGETGLLTCEGELQSVIRAVEQRTSVTNEEDDVRLESIFNCRQNGLLR